jgi:hypothetical protein
MKELKVFVDLAFISAGEETLNIDRVNCFHTAAIGYEPLIFMDPDAEGFDYLWDRMKLVFARIKSDPSLPGKLVETHFLLMHRAHTCTLFKLMAHSIVKKLLNKLFWHLPSIPIHYTGIL